ncbi:hypothetical protein Esti_004228 [Eimeria stiedai]
MSLTGLRHYPHKSPPSAVAWQFVSSRRTAASAYDENGLQMGSALSCECFDAAKEEAQLEVVPNTQSEEKTEKTILIVGGVKYIGEVKNGQKHGYGVLIRPCGSRFEGHFKNGVAHGEGKFFHPSGDKYEGQWKDNRATGKGKFTHADGSCYEGDWVCDVQQGEGVEKWIDGSSYKGQYKGGMKHGKGAFMWPDGSVYEGQFEENDIHGFGTYTWGDKKRYTGQWVHNHMDGQGQMRLADGRIHEGGYRYDKKHGKGKVIWPDGRWFEGEWVDGRQHGIGCYFSADGRPVSEVEWSFGKKISSTEAAANAVPESPALEGLQDGGRGVSDSTSLSNVREATAKEGGAPEKAEEEHGWLRSIDPAHAESVGDHSFGVAAHFVALPDENLIVDGEKADRARCMMMALVHDLAESVVGDLTPYDKVTSAEKRKREKSALEQICSSLAPERSAEIQALWEEYENGQTPEAQLVKDADKLEMIAQAFEYEKLHGVSLEEFFKSTEHVFKTKTFQALSGKLRVKRAQMPKAKELNSDHTNHP